MTARIYRSFEFQAGVYFSGDFYMNSYSLDLTFNVETDSIQEQNTALERIKYYLSDCIEHSVMVNETETDVIDKYLNADLRVCTLPEDPYDQIVGIMLMVKLNAITEGRLVVIDMSIESRMSDGVSCLYSIDEHTGPFTERGWWSDNSMKITNYAPKNKNKKVVRLSSHKADWDDVYLGWEQKETISATTKAEIVFASFDHKTDK